MVIYNKKILERWWIKIYVYPNKSTIKYILLVIIHTYVSNIYYYLA